MGYVIGIDLGTTFTAAAVLRGTDRPETVQLGNRAASTPSTVFLRDDNTLITGDAALRRGLADPGRLAREFKRRFGDPAPLLLGGVPVSADALTGRLLRATVDAVTEREGAPADAVAACHPANWGPYKLDLLNQACRHAGLVGVVTVSEPEAAAVHYAGQEHLDSNALVAVYDLGGGTFDAAVLRRNGDSFEILGAPDGIERLGGIDFDEAVVAHVRRALGDALDTLDPADPATLSTLSRLREECIDAKEALSGDTEASVAVVLPGLQTEVRITRVEFEAMIRMPLSETIDALRRALRSAAVKPEELAAVLLVGGSSRIPMVAEMVGAELGRPVTVDADPKHVVALGAARMAARIVAPARMGVAAAVPSAPVVAPSAPIESPPPAAPPSEPAAAPAVAAPDPELRAPVLARAPMAAPPVAGRAPAPRVSQNRGAPKVAPPARPPGGRRSRRGLIIGAAIAGVLALGAGALVLASAGGGDGGGAGVANDAAEGFVSPCPPDGDPSVCITSVSFVGDDLSVEFTSHDVDLGVDLVPIFFLTEIAESEAGSVSNRTSDWRAWGPTSPVQGTNDAGQSGWTADEIASSRTAVCALVGDTDGRVAQDTGNCAGLPPAP